MSDKAEAAAPPKKAKKTRSKVGAVGRKCQGLILGLLEGFFYHYGRTVAK